MRALYKLDIEISRMGFLYGIFIAEKDDVKKLIKSEIEVYLGEVLGKHSEIRGSIDESDITMITDDQELIERLEKLGIEVGYNPVVIAQEQGKL